MHSAVLYHPTSQRLSTSVILSEVPRALCGGRSRRTPMDHVPPQLPALSCTDSADASFSSKIPARATAARSTTTHAAKSAATVIVPTAATAAALFSEYQIPGRAKIARPAQNLD